MGLRHPHEVARHLEQTAGLERPTPGDLAVQVLASDLRACQSDASRQVRLACADPFERATVEQVGTGEVPDGEEEVAQALEHLDLLATMVAGQVLQLQEDPFVVVDRPLRFARRPGLLGRLLIVGEGFLTDLAQEVVSSELGRLMGEGPRAQALQGEGDLAVQDPKTALGQGAVDPGPELLLREPEPLAAAALSKDAAMHQALQLLGEFLLVRVHRPDQEREVELGTDGAGVRQDPVFLGGEVARESVR